MRGGADGRRWVGSKFQGVEPAFVLQCPGCEQQTVWVDVSRDRYVSIEFVPIKTGTGHTVVCSECELSMPIGGEELSWLRSLTMVRSGVPLTGCATSSVQELGVDWLEAREQDVLTKLRKWVHPLNSERLQLKRAGVSEEAVAHLMSGDDDERRAQVLIDLAGRQEPEVSGTLASLVSKLDPDIQRLVIKRVAKTGDGRHLSLLEGIRCDGSRRTTKVLNKAILQLQEKTA